MRIRKALAALVIGATVGISTAACPATNPPTDGTSIEVEVEDCDAEDFANKEDDCGFTEADRKKARTSKKPSPNSSRKRTSR